MEEDDKVRAAVKQITEEIHLTQGNDNRFAGWRKSINILDRDTYNSATIAIALAWGRPQSRQACRRVTDVSFAAFCRVNTVVISLAELLSSENQETRSIADCYTIPEYTM